MEEHKEVSKKRIRRRTGSSGATVKKQRKYSAETKLKAVKYYLEEQYPVKVISAEMGIGRSTLSKWLRTYRAEGAAGLTASSVHPQTRERQRSPLQEKIITLKQQTPSLGIKKISQLLGRLFFIKTSAETVRKTLHQASLIEHPRRRRQKNMVRPRFFERSTPNQLWQTDIFTFRLGGKQAYLIGYIDDYSRYITGLGLYRSQTAEHVLEVFRIAAAEYRPPKELLTDNGRQYTNWRGTSRFEAELQKERIKHIKSRPHHPMTLGKIERFWKTIYE